MLRNIIKTVIIRHIGETRLGYSHLHVFLKTPCSIDISKNVFEHITVQ